MYIYKTQIIFDIHIPSFIILVIIYISFHNSYIIIFITYLLIDTYILYFQIFDK